MSNIWNNSSDNLGATLGTSLLDAEAKLNRDSLRNKEIHNTHKSRNLRILHYWLSYLSFCYTVSKLGPASVKTSERTNRSPGSSHFCVSISVQTGIGVVPGPGMFQTVQRMPRSIWGRQKSRGRKLMANSRARCMVDVVEVAEIVII